MYCIKITKKIGIYLIVFNFTCNLANASLQPPLETGVDNGDLLTKKCHILRAHLLSSPPITPAISVVGSKKYWVLSLDGGGVRGLLHLKTLARLEAQTKKPVAHLFDAIAGTSVGGFIATLLTLPDSANPSQPKYSAQGLLDEILANKEKIFQSKWQSFGGIFRTKYKTTFIRNYLQGLLGKNNFKNRLLPTVLVTHDLHTYNQRLFSTNANEDFDAWAVVMGTSASPTYFKPQDVFPKLADGTYTSPGYFVSDGGTCMNNPALAGIALVREHYKTSDVEVPLENIEILSLGTGAVNIQRENAALRRGGALSWIGELATLSIDGQESADEYVVKNYFGAHYHRFNPILDADIKLDDISETSKQALLAASDNMFTQKGDEFNNNVVVPLSARTLPTQLPTSTYGMIQPSKNFFQRTYDWFSAGFRNILRSL